MDDKSARAKQGVRFILEWIGEDPDREGLRETPERVIRAWLEMTRGNATDPAKHLEKDFDIDDGTGLVYDQMILSTGIPFSSNCEHHMMPFTGLVHVAYIPGKRVVGLSKLARVVEGYAQRLQVQERLTQQIATSINSKLEPLGVGVLVVSTHSCQCNRGVRKGGQMVTSAYFGTFKNEIAVRKEFLESINISEGGR